jgi:CHAT domain-containing protein
MDEKKRVLLVEYFMAKDNILLMGIRCDFEEPKITKISIDSNELSRFIYTNFGEYNNVKTFIDMELEDIWQSYNVLVEPIVDWSDPEDIICLVPHRLLHHLPLHALKTKSTYLIERNPVCYVPSASVLKYCQSKRMINLDRTPDSNEVAIFGDSCNNLSGARAEAKSIAQQFGVKPLLGSDVTRSNFLHRIENASIIHIAGHSYFFAKELINSGLQLTGNDVLTVHDILSLRSLNTHLIVLSGCETGINRTHPGDELVGMTRAFLYAGTRSIIVSLWRVEDDSTTFLMKRFYSHLCHDSPIYIVDALRQAMLDTMSKPQWAPFYYWAPFALVGDWK